MICYSLYKQPKLSISKFVPLIEHVMMKCGDKASNIMIIGDLNIHFLNTCNCLDEIIGIYGMTNIVKNATCKKSIKASLINVIITNVPKRFQNVTNIDVGLSDFHDMICCATKAHVTKKVKTTISYRSYTKFDSSMFQRDLALIPFHVSNVFDDVDDSYWFCEQLALNVINEHAPMKTRILTTTKCCYMNGELRKAMNVRDMLRRKYESFKCIINWERYRRQRNLVVKLRKKVQYTKDKCFNQAGTREFWKNVKPLLSDKNKTHNTNIVLMDDDTVVNDLPSVCNIFNDYFVKMSQHIGDTIEEDNNIESIVNKYSHHKSAKNIIRNSSDRAPFNFRPVSVECVHAKLIKLNVHKGTGYDNIPAKMVKIGASVLCYPIQYILNRCISTGIFPDALKCGEVRPIYKTNDSLFKGNYRPVSVSCISKVFECILLDQMTEYFDCILSPHLSGFRKQHSYQSVLRFVED